MIPYKTPVGTTYDSGDFPAIVEMALARADAAGFAARRARSAAAGKRRGFGVSCFLEIAGGQPGEGAGDQLSREQPAACWRSAFIRAGRGTRPSIGGSSPNASAFRSSRSKSSSATASIRFRAPALSHRARRCRSAARWSRPWRRSSTKAGGSRPIYSRRPKRTSSIATESSRSPAPTASSPSSRSPERARRSRRRGSHPEDLDTKRTADVPPSFPNGCHIAEVEIDPETGAVELAAYNAVDDCGNVLQPVLVEGQVQGGIAQGVGQALLEAGVYDAASGQLLTGSFIGLRNAARR